MYVAPDIIAPSIRNLAASDSLDALTSLLHRAYAPLAAAGLNYTAADQSADVTAQRVQLGECAVAVADGVLIGTITVERPDANAGCAWYRDAGVASAHQFAVDPGCQRCGVGSRLLRWAEAWARRHGYLELAVDTAEPAAHLIAFYGRQGYRFVEFAQWEGKRYRSVILSRRLATA